MGCRGSKVRILSPRPKKSTACTWKGAGRFHWRGTSCRRRRQKGTRFEGHPELTSPMRAAEPESRAQPRTDLFRLLVEEATDYAIFVLDTEGRVATWNKGAERLKGYTPEEIIGKHFSVFYPPEAT